MHKRICTIWTVIFAFYGNQVSPRTTEMTFRTERRVPRLGVMLVGWGGNNGTTVTAAVLANKLGLTWRNKTGVKVGGLAIHKGTHSKRQWFGAWENTRLIFSKNHFIWMDIVCIWYPLCGYQITFWIITGCTWEEIVIKSIKCWNKPQLYIKENHIVLFCKYSSLYFPWYGSRGS